MKSITVRLDEELKAQAEAVLARLEISPTQAITHLYLYLAQHGQLPFRVRPVAESPEEVYRATLARVRSVTELMTTVAGLPAEAYERAGMTELCLSRCLQLRQHIAGNVPFMAAVASPDALPWDPEEDTGLYWQSVQEYLTQAENVLKASSGGVPPALGALSGKIKAVYWQLATYIDPYGPAGTGTFRQHPQGENNSKA